MDDNKKDNESDLTSGELRLPKGTAHSDLPSPINIEACGRVTKGLLDFNDIKELVGAYDSSDPLRIEKAESFYTHCLANFLNSIPEDGRNRIGRYATVQSRIPMLAKAWDEFVVAELAEPFSQPFYKEKWLPEEVAGDKAELTIKLFPLFSQRRVMHLLRQQHFGIYAELTCSRPEAAYGFQELSDPNSSNDTVTEDYFSVLSHVLKKALKGLKSEQLVCAHNDFISVVISPYRRFYDSRLLSDRVIENGQTHIATIAELFMARMVGVYEFHSDQVSLISLPGGEFIPPPLTPEALGRLSLLWSREQSEHFFKVLPARIIKNLKKEEDPLYHELVFEFREHLKRASESSGKALEKAMRMAWSVPKEFPPVQKRELLSEKLRGIEDRYAVVSGEEKSELERTRLDTMLELFEQLGQEKKDLDNDCQREEGLLYAFEQRRISFPWETAALDAEILELQRQHLRHKVRSRNLHYRLISVERELGSLSQSLSRHFDELSREARKISAHSKKGLLEREVDHVLSVADRLLPPLRKSLKCAIEATELSDPIAAGQFSVPHHNSRVGRELASHFENSSFQEIEKYIGQDSELLQVVGIFRQLDAGVPAKRVKKQFPDHLVDTVVLRSLMDSKPHEVVKKEYPHHETLIHLIEQRNRLDDFMRIHCENISACYQVLLSACADRWEENSLSRVEKTLLRSEAFSVVWQWYSVLIENPYCEQSNRTKSRLGLEEKAKRFQSWVEHEIAKMLGEQHSDLYQILLLKKPGSVFAVEKLFDLNWQDTYARREYIASLANSFIAFASHLSVEDILTAFKQFTVGLRSPFSSLRDSSGYDLDDVSSKLFFLSTKQQRLFTSEMRRGLINDWVRANDLVLFGSDQQTGFLSVLLLEKIEQEAPDMHNRIMLAMAEEDTESRYYLIELLEKRKQMLSGVRLEECRDDISILRVQLGHLDLLKSVLEKNMKSYVRS